MPTMPVKDNGESQVDSPSLNVPENQENVVEGEKPVVYDNHENKVSNSQPVPVAPKSGIEVIALRPGFIGQRRRKVGDRFKVAKFEALGEWMKCVDPTIEKKRIEFFKEKKKAKV